MADARRVAYEPVRREARDAELTDLVAAGSQVVSDASTRWPLYLLATEDGEYPCRFTSDGWEELVLHRELKDTDLVGWYRNPTSGANALRVAWQGGQRERAMCPDFQFFRNTDAGIRPSIVDPHGFHLHDAAAKLRGLAAYAQWHGDAFEGIDAVASY